MYILNLTELDVDTITFVGSRYGWSNALLPYCGGRNEIPEHEAWGLAEAFESDCEGGHSMFPMLSHDSRLYAKLAAFVEDIV